MTDLPSHPGTDDSGAGPDGGSSPARRSRWISVAWIVIAIVLVLLFIVLHMTGILGPGGH